MPDEIESKSRSAGFTVGGVRLKRPFRIRRLGHFGINVMDPETSLDFYTRLLGFRISDPHDMGARLPPELRDTVGPTIGYFLRHGTDHHSFVIFPRRAIDARRGGAGDHPEVTTNQITWQVGSLREVTEGCDWFGKTGIKIYRSGRDAPGSNWHVYPYDPDGHVNELYYGIEQIGWDGASKPRAMHLKHYAEPPVLPHISEYHEVKDGIAAGVDPLSGWHDQEKTEEKYDVGGVLLGRPFKIVKIGPVRLFVDTVQTAVDFYVERLGLTVTEEVSWKGHRCVFLRANTEHHSLGLYPKALRAELGLASFTTLFSFGLQLGDYKQLKDAVDFLKRQSVTIKHLPPELFPGIDYTAFAIDPDGYAMQLSYYMEQIGWDGRPRPAADRPKIDNDKWPEAVPEQPDTFLGEPFLGPWG
jgi:catechol 2,3-dioxygenase-like lactoylglutathione lyase family enzyme